VFHFRAYESAVLELFWRNSS